jgi:TPP-dependent pyruvate/acetoin dehydrogenase alpha subunit
MDKKNLIEFEKEISELFLNREILVPIHLSGNNEDQLINIFKYIKPNDWVFSTHRNHYHALLKGYNPIGLRELIISGESMHIYNKRIKFFTSSIVAGVLPIALGVSMAIKRRNEKDMVWVFVGDMTSETGMFHECRKYAARNDLPITFIVEDNGYSTDTPTQESWGKSNHRGKIIRYKYNRKWPHVGCGEWVSF